MMKDLTGVRFGYAVVTPEYIKGDKFEDLKWKLVCDCGTEFFVKYVNLRHNPRGLNCGTCRSPRGTHKYGDWYLNKRGQKFKLLSIENNADCLMEDVDGNRFVVSYCNLTGKSFVSPWDRSVAGIGYFGVGPFKSKIMSKEHTPEYEDWNSMLKRCYVGKASETTYRKVTVDESWHNFQTFAEWCTKQIGFATKDFALDKDLLVRHANRYSPETCCYLPREINSFIKRNRKNDLPLGVDIGRRYNGTTYFRVQARENGKNIILGAFETAEEAFNAYKKHKESLAKQLAEKWKGRISDAAYEALMDYTVEITD